MQHQPALYDAFLLPVYFFYKTVGAPAMDALCALPFFTGYGRQFCPSGMWICVGGNALLVLYMAVTALAAALARRLARACRRAAAAPSKLKAE
jgi:hypothetical protein